MTVLWLLASLLSALGFYLACAHQTLWPAARRHARMLRLTAWFALMPALLAGIGALGTWAGAFAVLTALMLWLVALPYLDAWRQDGQGRQKKTRHVG